MGGFNSEEILEIACQIERNGAYFYERAAGLFNDEKSKKMLLELANMEKGHEAFFEGLKNDPSGFDASLADPEGTAGKYLRAIASNHVFVSAEKRKINSKKTQL